MQQKEPSELTDQELLEEAKKTKLTPITNALFIGFMIGIIIFSIVKNTVGLFTLIPLFFIYKLVKNSKNNEVVEKEIKARSLK